MDKSSGKNQSHIQGLDPISLSKAILPILVILVALGMFLTSWYKVQPDEQGVVLFLGKYAETVGPGLHFKMPFGIQSVEKVKVTIQQKEEFGFRTDRPGVQTQYSTQEFDDESLIVTGDLSIADVEWVVQYKIQSPPTNYLFKVKNNRATFRVMNEAIMRKVIGDRTVNEVLTSGRAEIETVTRDQLQALCDSYEMGLRIEGVFLQDVNPPKEVKPAFDAVNKAQQEKQTQINEAMQEYNKSIPRARGEAEQVIEQARGYAIERVNQAQGEANRFQAIYQAYQEAPEVTRRRMYLETMQKVLQKIGAKYITDPKGSGIIPLLNIQNHSNP